MQLERLFFIHTAFIDKKTAHNIVYNKFNTMATKKEKASLPTK